jgi:transcription elongation factor Elf1
VYLIFVLFYQGYNRKCKLPLNEIKVDLVGMINVWSIFKVVSDNLILKWFVNKENIIYLLECAICGLQYIGETKQQLSKRLNGYKLQT